MATAVATKPTAPHQQKMKRPPLPNVQTNNIQPSAASRSPSASSKRPPSGFRHPTANPTNSVNGEDNGLASRLGNRRRDSQKPGDPPLRTRNGKAGPDGGGRVNRKIMEPYVKTQAYILKKYRNKPPSLIVHLHPTHFRFDQQDGSFSYNSPMKFVLEHLKSQTLPHDMLEELQNSQVKFYEGCLIVQVQDHRTASGTSSSAITNAADTEKNIPFSIHNYNEHLTPSPYVPYPHKADSVTDGIANKGNSQSNSDSASGPKDKQEDKGPKVFTVVLFPTPLSLHEEVRIQANMPDPRVNRKQLANVPRTPASATVPPTPLSAIPPTPSANGPPPQKKLKMSISGSEVHGFESKAVATTAPPLFLEPVDNIEDAHKVLQTLVDPRHKESHPNPKARKRTEADLAADEAIAAQEKAFMLIMDERHAASGAAGVKAGTTDGEAGTASFEPRFETWQAIKNIKAEHKERAEREAAEKITRDAAAAANKSRIEQQERLNRQETEQRALQVAHDQQNTRSMQRQAQINRDMQARDAQRQHALAAGQNQLAHGHPMPVGVTQAQNSSPIVRNMTPNTNSSPLVNSIPMNSQVASSPVRPTSATQHGHPGGVAMVQQRSRQRAPSRTSTPQINGTPSMQQATPRAPQGSPPMVSNPAMSRNLMASQHLNGQPTLLSQQQQAELIQQQQQAQARRHQIALQQQQQQRMQNGSPNPQMSPDRHPGNMNLQHQAALNQQRQQQDYKAQLQMHHQQGLINGHPNMPIGASPPQHHPGQPGHPQQHPQLQFSHVHPNQAQLLEQNRQKAYHQVMMRYAQRYGGDINLISEEEKQHMKHQVAQLAQNMFRDQMMQLEKRRQQQQVALAQLQMQQRGTNGMGMPGMNGPTINGISGQQMSEEQMRQMAAMRQFNQVPQMAGGGLQNINGGQHNPHLNGAGMGGM